MRASTLTTTRLFVTLTILASVASAQTNDPNKVKDQLTGDANGRATSNPQCKLFTPVEISAYLGSSVGAGQNAAGGAGCSWSDKDYEAQAIVTVVGPEYFPEPSLVKGFKRLQGIGKKAWVAPDSGWSAGALLDDSAVVVNLDSEKASEASVVALLQETLKRRKK
jgi:hypothetical protein